MNSTKTYTQALCRIAGSYYIWQVWPFASIHIPIASQACFPCSPVRPIRCSRLTLFTPGKADPKHHPLLRTSTGKQSQSASHTPTQIALTIIERVRMCYLEATYHKVCLHFGADYNYHPCGATFQGKGSSYGCSNSIFNGTRTLASKCRECAAIDRNLRQGPRYSPSSAMINLNLQTVLRR